jgi:hypothetical protein
VAAGSSPARSATLESALGASLHPPRSYLQVIQVEYRLGLSRARVRAGRLRLEVIDRGQDPHNLHLRRFGAAGERATPELGPGARVVEFLNLAPGRYRLWCSLPEHARLGMHAVLTVVR